MAVTVYIPTPFRRATGDRDRVDTPAGSLGEVLDRLEREYAGLRGLVRNERGEIHHHINVYVNNEEASDLTALVADGSEVAIIPALAGGRPWS